jgi:hypothetical protein
MKMKTKKSILSFFSSSFFAGVCVGRDRERERACFTTMCATSFVGFKGKHVLSTR